VDSRRCGEPQQGVGRGERGTEAADRAETGDAEPKRCGGTFRDLLERYDPLILDRPVSYNGVVPG